MRSVAVVFCAALLLTAGLAAAVDVQALMCTETTRWCPNASIEELKLESVPELRRKYCQATTNRDLANRSGDRAVDEGSLAGVDACNNAVKACDDLAHRIVLVLRTKGVSEPKCEGTAASPTKKPPPAKASKK